MISVALHCAAAAGEKLQVAMRHACKWLRLLLTGKRLDNVSSSQQVFAPLHSRLGIWAPPRARRTSHGDAYMKGSGQSSRNHRERVSDRVLMNAVAKSKKLNETEVAAAALL